MKIRSSVLGILVLVIFFGGIMFTSGLNIWETKSQRIPSKFDSGETAGEYNPADIRGSYSFGDISSLFSIPIEDLQYAFVLPDDVDLQSFQNKDLELLYVDLKEIGTEIGTASVRLFVALYTGLPYSLDGEETYLPYEAVEILKERGNLNAEQTAYLEEHVVDLSALEGDAPEDTSDDAATPDNVVEPTADTNADQDAADEVTADEETHVPVNEAGGVKGNTSFREVLDLGVPQEIIEGIIGDQLPNPLTNIKDYCLENGLEFGVIKLELQDAIDNLGQP
ncbi:MAG: hypothetical protein MUO76_13645 [Anaerolineaceae bacterium]|nr:hypothetical protein [Anaerolineaceae bacterium]